MHLLNSVGVNQFGLTLMAHLKRESTLLPCSDPHHVGFSVPHLVLAVFVSLWWPLHIGARHPQKCTTKVI